jgi:uncharacterized protein
MLNQVQMLKNYLMNIGKNGLCIAFSGGVDSALLVRLASECKIQTITVTFDTVLHPSADLKQAAQIAKEYGVSHDVIFLDEMQNSKVSENAPDRCYHCKYMLFEKLKQYAREHGIDSVADGTNADDYLVYRPGLQALRELEIYSPLAECGITKDQVRQIAAQMGISVAKRPSTPCLATRFPYGTHLTIESLKKVETAEREIRDMGFYNVRVRCYQDLARIEVDSDAFAQFISEKDQIIRICSQQGFRYVTLDLEGFRSGSMDLMLENKKNPR